MRGVPSIYPKSTLYSDIVGLGLSSSLQLCLDVGDIASYDGVSQNWLDRSANAQTLFRGATSGAEASDPTFNGTVGRHFNETYFSFDGGDFFRFSTANPVWVENLHKDNAAFSLLALVYLPVTANQCPLIGDNGGSSASIGIYFHLNQSGPPAFFVARAVGGSPALDKAATTALNTNAWNIVGLSINEAGGNVSFMYLNGSYNQVGGSNTFDAAYTSPSASSATTVLDIGAYGGGGSPIASGARLAALSMWSSALSKANMDSLYSTQRRRLGI